MFSNVINVGKDIANKIGNKFLNLSEIEIKIKEATNDDQWGPHGSLMKEISDETFSSLNLNEIMTFLWFRMFTEKPINKRRTYKALVLLSYLIIHGSDFVAIKCKDHIGDIRRLEIFSDSNGIPDASVRKKARDICDILADPGKLQTEREKHKNNQQKIYGQIPNTGSDSFSSSRPSSIETSFGDFDSWQPRSKSIPFVIGESFVNFVNTFTQNISGPPPTETHDNFDLPTYYDNEPQLYSNKDTQLSTDDKQSCSNINRQIPDIIEIKEKAQPVPVIEKEAPIIDFFEPLPTADVFQTDFLLEFNNTVNNRAQTDDFGDFSGWENAGNKITDKPICQTQTTDFFLDFDSLDHKMIVTDTSIAPKPSDTNDDKSKAVKLGSTWTDIGSLKIDLDNVCGGRRPMYSKS